MNNTPPALSAANLNKLSTELKSQATRFSIVNTLPTWVDGTVPALSNPVPLNEMERVLQLVAAAAGLSAYTKTTWSADWAPPRNATNLNKMEAQAQANRGRIDVLDNPPTSIVSPLGYLNNRASTGYFPASNVNSYSVVATYPPRPAAFTGTHLIYRSAIAGQNGFNNLSQTVITNNNWALHAPNGSLQTFLPQGGVIGNPALPAYQQAWCNETLSKLQALNVNGFWCDNVHPNITAVTAGVYPQEYPNDESYRLALLSWATFVFNFFNSRGYKCAYNTGVVLDDTAALATAWWPRIGPKSHYLTEEHWIYPGGNIRRQGTAHWYDYWDQHRSLHNVALNSGSKFLPLNVLGGDQVKRYGLGTFLLDWTGNSGACMWSEGITTNDPWTAFWGQAVALGAPAGAAFKVGNIWRRNFANGVLNVDPVGTADATITL